MIRKFPRKRNSQFFKKRIVVVIAIVLPVLVLFFYKSSPHMPIVGKFVSKAEDRPINQAQWNKMVKQFEKMARGYKGNVGIYFKDLGSGNVWEYKEDRLFI